MRIVLLYNRFVKSIQDHLFFFFREEFNFPQLLFRVGQRIIQDRAQTSMNLVNRFTGKYMGLIMPLQLKYPMNIPVGKINVNGEWRRVIRRKMTLKTVPGILDIRVTQESDIQEINRIKPCDLPELLQKQVKGVTLMILQNIIHLSVVLLYKILENQVSVCFYPQGKRADKRTNDIPMVLFAAIVIGSGDHHIIRACHPRYINRKG